MNKNPKFDREAFKRAIAGVESSGGTMLSNPNSSAAGKYHFLYRYISKDPLLKGVSKREFINRPDLHEKIMDKALDGTLTGYKGYIKNAQDLKKEYDTNLREDEIAALTHFLGSGGVRKYLSNPSEFKVPGVNSSVEGYVSKFNEYQRTTPSFEENPNRRFQDKGYAPSFDSSMDGIPQEDPYDYQREAIIPEIYSNKNEDNRIEINEGNSIPENNLHKYNFLKNMTEGYTSPEEVNQPTLNADIPINSGIENPAVESNLFAQGGLIDPNKKPISKNEVDSSKSFIQDYHNSPKFKERYLNDFGSNKSDQMNSMINDINMNFNSSNDKLIEGSGDKIGSNYNDIDNSLTIYDRERIGDSGNSGLPAHEYSHMSERYDFLNSREMMDNVSSRQINNNSRSNDFSENRADLNSARYLMNKGGFNDARTQDFSSEDLKTLRENYSNDGGVQRLNSNFKDEDLIWMMNNVAYLDDNNNNINQAKYGGNINNFSNNKDLVEFKGGGTHEENSLGGIPQGIGANGKINTVEEDETKYTFDNGDYVFSNRIKTDGTGFKSSSSNQFANGGNTDPKKRPKVKNERYAGAAVRDNLRYDARIPTKPLTENYKDALQRNAISERQGEINTHVPQGSLDKALEVALNPSTALGYKVRGQDIPDNFSRGKRNATDYALDIINPAQYVNDTKNVVQGTAEGDLSKVGLGLAGIVPLGLEARSIKNAITKGGKGVNKLVDNYLPEPKPNLNFKNQPKRGEDAWKFKNNINNSNFKSEIDWGKWNKEIPNNKELMIEYEAIEKASKADGTWMKNPDGSAFKGAPEQFVQQNSDNFKKAFPNAILDDSGNIQANYHGSPYKFEEFKLALKSTDKTGERLGSGIYTTPKRTKALEYAVKNQNKKGTLYELYQNANNKQTAIQDIDNYITTKIEKIKSDFLNKKISNQKSNELYDAVLKENDELWDKIPDSEFKLQRGKDYLRIDDEQVVPFNNYPKSMIGNNGMFDMTNPNIYKSLIPAAIGVGAASQNTNNFSSGVQINTVEEEETKYTFDDGDYVFSNRIKI